MADVKNIEVSLGESAARFCSSVVEGHSDFGAPLQSRLRLRSLSTPFAFLPQDRAERASADFIAGGIANEKTIADYLVIASRHGLPLTLVVREGTRLSGPLQEAVRQGAIKLLEIL